MTRLLLAAAGLLVLALGPCAAIAQTVAPAYHWEREYFHVGPALPGAGENPAALDQTVPSPAGQTHVPSNSVQGRGSGHVEFRIIDR